MSTESSAKVYLFFLNTVYQNIIFLFILMIIEKKNQFVKNFKGFVNKYDFHFEAKKGIFV